MHKFKVGDAVSFVSAFFGTVGHSSYTVTRLLPPHDNEFQYRIKSIDESFERVVQESQLDLGGGLEQLAQGEIAINDKPLTSCPICKSQIRELGRTGEATGFDCSEHGKFKVTDTALSTSACKGATRELWERALILAKRRAHKGDWPLMQHYDFV